MLSTIKRLALRASALTLDALQKLTPIAVAFLCFAIALPVFAQDAVAAVDFTNEEALAKLIFDAVENKQWGLLVSLLLTGTVALGRKYIPESTKLGAWLRGKVGAIISTLLLALGGGFTMQFLAGAPFSAAMVLKAVQIALSANGAWSVWKNIKEALGESKAVEAGKAAETKPPTDTLNQ